MPMGKECIAIELTFTSLFDSKYLHILSYGCAISDEDEIVLSGGFSTKRVSKYNRAGWVSYLPDMIYYRREHSCGSFINSDNFKVNSNILILAM